MVGRSNFLEAVPFPATLQSIIANLSVLAVSGMALSSPSTANQHLRIILYTVYLSVYTTLYPSHGAYCNAIPSDRQSILIGLSIPNLSGLNSGRVCSQCR